MHLDLASLPTDTALLHQLVRDLAAGMEQRDGEIEKLRLIIRRLQRDEFGRRSERLDPDQLQLHKAPVVELGAGVFAEPPREEQMPASAARYWRFSGMPFFWRQRLAASPSAIHKTGA